jgi:hypothetical protein
VLVVFTPERHVLLARLSVDAPIPAARDQDREHHDQHREAEPLPIHDGSGCIDADRSLRRLDLHFVLQTGSIELPL